MVKLGTICVVGVLLVLAASSAADKVRIDAISCITCEQINLIQYLTLVHVSYAAFSNAVLRGAMPFQRGLRVETVGSVVRGA